MQDSKTREKILKKVRSALIEPTNNPFPKSDTDVDLFRYDTEDREIIFANNFSESGGHFFYADTKATLLEDLNSLFKSMKWSYGITSDSSISEFFAKNNFPIGKSSATALNDAQVVKVTNCSCLIARTGQIVFSEYASKISDGRNPIIVIADLSQVVVDISDAVRMSRPGTSRPNSAIRIVSPTAENQFILFLLENRLNDL